MKNKIFLGLVLGIFLIGLVSASITGYLVSRGGGIAEAGYTATLKKVEGTTAIVSVQTPTGDTELVRVVEGGTAKVRDATISASSLTRGTLFRRGGGNIGLNISNISAAPVPIKVPGAIVFPSPTCNGVYDDTLNTNTFRYWAKKNNLDYHEYISVTSNSGQHYFLDFRPRSDYGNNWNETDVYNVVTGQYEATDKIAGDAVTIGNIQITIVEVYVNATDKYVDLEISGGYFSDSCTIEASLCAAQQCVKCNNGWLVELEDMPTTFKYWDKKNNIDYNDYLLAVSSSGQASTLDFRPRSDYGNNWNETDVYSKCTQQFIATDKVAGDVVNIGDVSFTIESVFVNATDKYVDLQANSGTSFRKMCVFS